LHQTITVVFGFYLINWLVGIPLKFLVVASGTFLGCWIVYEILIKRNNLMRLCFGLKVKKSAQQIGLQVERKAITSYVVE